MGLKLGISKAELMREYYFDEIPLIFDRYNALFGGGEGKKEDAYADDLW
ncbi:MAG TPA: hypothetical protein PKB13_09845 [Clostridia bacterium]|nr:hypothetical protein [Clostridia bacterium]